MHTGVRQPLFPSGLTHESLADGATLPEEPWGYVLGDLFGRGTLDPGTLLVVWHSLMFVIRPGKEQGRDLIQRSGLTRKAHQNVWEYGERQLWHKSPCVVTYTSCHVGRWPLTF